MSTTDTTAAPATGAAAPPAVLGIDPSLTATGIADHNGTCRLISGDLRGTDRIDWITSKLLDLLSGIHLVVIEGPSYGSMSGAGHHEAAGLWWRIACEFAHHRVPYAVVPPSSLKKYATGSGKATKPDMRVELLKRVGLDLRDDNQVDAFWLRAAGLDQLGHPVVDLPKTNREALAKVTWPKAVIP